MSPYQFLSLSTKPSAKLCYSFHPAVGTAKPVLIVFVNGLGLPQTSWEGAITRLQTQPPAAGLPAMLTYDRYGQGQTTDRDPDDNTEDPMHGHDTLTVVRDLHQLITQIATEKMGISNLNPGSLSLVLVSNSIGGALVRLYAQEYPGTVAGLLFLDSVLANSDFVSIYPDPDAPGFDPTSLPDGVTVDAIRAARAYMQRVFHPSNGSREGLSRKNLAQLLPDSDGPKLQGPDGGPWVTVIGHEFEAFKTEFEQMGGAPPRLTEVYMNPYWHRFNEGLAKLTEPAYSKGPLQAPGAGHFVQRDNPELVANELREILDKIL